jgi:hypothetical protein
VQREVVLIFIVDGNIISTLLSIKTNSLMKKLEFSSKHIKRREVSGWI